MVPPCTAVTPQSDHSDRSSLQGLEAHPAPWGSRHGARVKGERKSQGGSSGQPGLRKCVAVGSSIPPTQSQMRNLGAVGSHATPTQSQKRNLGAVGSHATPNQRQKRNLGAVGSHALPNQLDEKVGCSGKGRLCSRVPSSHTGELPSGCTSGTGDFSPDCQHLSQTHRVPRC